MKINEIYSAMLLIFILFNVAVGIIVYKKNHNRVKLSFLKLLLFISIYSFGYSQELLNTDLDKVMFWIKVEYLGLAFIAYSWIMFFIELSGNLEGVIQRVNKVLITFSTVIVVIVWTTEFHHLFYKSVSMVDKGGFFLLDIERGPLYHLFSGYNLFVILVTTYITVYMIVKYSGAIRKQFMMLALALFFAWISQYMNIFLLMPYGFDMAPFFLCILDVIIGYSVIKYKMVSILPIAYDKVFENMNEAVVVTDVGGNLVGYNKAMKTLFPHINKDNVGNHYSVLNRHMKAMAEVQKNIDDNIRDFNITIDAGQKVLNVKASKIIEKGQKTGEIFLINEVTNEMKYLDELKYMANYDSLTNIYNRRYFFDTAVDKICKNHGDAISAIVFDLDNFKTINDVYGHHIGDIALKEVSWLAKKEIEDKGFIGRIGGEEFAVILEGQDMQKAVEITNEIKSKLDKYELIVENKKVSVSASFGVAEYNQENDSYEELIKRADKAMYKAKELGKNRVEYLEKID